MMPGFGVCCEPKHFQVNYLVDEASYIGKGANSTISLVHDFLDCYGGYEEDLSLHADNWVGQNKNNAVIQCVQ